MLQICKVEKSPCEQSEQGGSKFNKIKNLHSPMFASKNGEMSLLRQCF